MSHLCSFSYYTSQLMCRYIILHIPESYAFNCTKKKVLRKLLPLQGRRPSHPASGYTHYALHFPSSSLHCIDSQTLPRLRNRARISSLTEPMCERKFWRASLVMTEEIVMVSTDRWWESYSIFLPIPTA